MQQLLLCNMKFHDIVPRTLGDGVAARPLAIASPRQQCHGAHKDGNARSPSQDSMRSVTVTENQTCGKPQDFVKFEARFWNETASSFKVSIAWTLKVRAGPELGRPCTARARE